MGYMSFSYCSKKCCSLLLALASVVPCRAVFVIMPKLRRNTTSTSRRALASHTKSCTTTNDSSSNFDLANAIVQELHQRANPQTKAWFTNYVKNTEWIGCKVPVVRRTIQDVLRLQSMSSNTNSKKSKKPATTSSSTTTTTSNTTYLLDNGIRLLQHPACDAKLGGMILLSEHVALNELATHAVLDRFDKEVWNTNTDDNHNNNNDANNSSSNDNNSRHHFLNDWSSADWFSARVLSKIGFSGQHDLAERILAYTQLSSDDNNNNNNASSSLWQRRCGVVSFLHYHKHRDKLPPNFGLRLIQACETSLLCSPQERFTQTGIAWVLRYVLLSQRQEEQEAALAMICRNGSLWTTEAKKSLVEKLSMKDPRRTKILSLS